MISTMNDLKLMPLFENGVIDRRFSGVLCRILANAASTSLIKVLLDNNGPPRSAYITGIFRLIAFAIGPLLMNDSL
jgi:hypothetical protein